MTRQMALEPIFTRMEPNTKGNGSMIFNKVMGLNNGEMVQNIKVTTRKEKKMDLASISGQMVQDIKEIGVKEKFQVKVFMSGWMAEFLMESG